MNDCIEICIYFTRFFSAFRRKNAGILKKNDLVFKFEINSHTFATFTCNLIEIETVRFCTTNNAFQILFIDWFFHLTNVVLESNKFFNRQYIFEFGLFTCSIISNILEFESNKSSKSSSSSLI